MKRLHASFPLFAVAALAACAAPLAGVQRVLPTSAHPVPSHHLINRIEALLLRKPCGSLDRWARFYRWQPEPRDYNGSSSQSEVNRHEKVEILLREAGKFGYREGSFIEPSPPPLMSNQIYIEGDERDYLTGSGSYDVASDTLTIRHCGPNRNADPGELIGHIRRR